MENSPGEKIGAMDWENRTLCSDESCIGIIGPDGPCQECGQPSADKASGNDVQAEAVSVPSEDQVQLQEKPVEEEAADDPAEDINWENRTLCSDESCIGVIGPDGRCQECGKPAD
ncbi:MAG: hypothetical protein Q8P24_17180 [Desulfobacterales bacterium]|nr:hypothetical protein [Desulfobacterales bacterium]